MQSINAQAGGNIAAARREEAAFLAQVEAEAQAEAQTPPAPEIDYERLERGEYARATGEALQDVERSLAALREVVGGVLDGPHGLTDTSVEPLAKAVRQIEQARRNIDKVRGTAWMAVRHADQTGG